MATSIADAQILGLNVTLNLNGTVNCTLNSTIGGPPFPNATVQLQCPPGINITTAITNSLGQFNLNVSVPRILPSLLNCSLVVLTPLANCNASLPPVGRLVSGPLAVVRVDIINNTITIFLRLLGLFFNAEIGSG
ncbi:unnamed protein product [Fraxinus pennsylvanica]|uniref:Pollen Ole e 1 allergen and extensin family protein n=1 Tax=Fraxinus pennsylvanica TaxID=56036 RepID=A0AAD1Z9T4_9LAMI|nr:unnamed protein product [Fraxinus pennsylvanica]